MMSPSSTMLRTFLKIDTFSITVDGRLFIKHYLADGFSHVSSNLEQYHRAVEEQGFSDEFKKDFNGFLDKLKDRSQDAAADIRFNSCHFLSNKGL